MIEWTNIQAIPHEINIFEYNVKYNASLLDWDYANIEMSYEYRLVSLI
jgi:hypothetical protein